MFCVQPRATLMTRGSIFRYHQTNPAWKIIKLHLFAQMQSVLFTFCWSFIPASLFLHKCGFKQWNFTSKLLCGALWNVFTKVISDCVWLLFLEVPVFVAAFSGLTPSFNSLMHVFLSFLLISFSEVCSGSEMEEECVCLSIKPLWRSF